MRTFYEQSNIGRSKYVVNYHDGVKTHADGSPLYDIAIFRNKVKKARFITKLCADGYLPRG